MVYWEMIQAITARWEGAGMAIESLELSNLGPFRPRSGERPEGETVSAVDSSIVRIDFDEQVNLFTGPNNVGKSTILQAVNLLTQRWTEDFQLRYQQYVGFSQDPSSVSVAIEWRNDQNQHLRFQSDYGLLSGTMEQIDRRNVDDDRVGYIFDFDTAAREEKECRYAEWDMRKSRDFGYVGFVTHTNYRLDILPNTTLLARHNTRTTEFDRDVDDTIQRILARITDNFSVKISAIDGRPGNMRVSAQTIDGYVSSNDLSLGTQYVLGWVVRLVVGYAQKYADDNGWRARPGIFIIDDIDAHLHPSWQRRIIPTLSEYFPNVQIFASTHSPMMVAGHKKGQVHLLKRDETGRVVWSRNEQDIIGWTADEIYRTFMGIDDPTDERTARHAEELRKLREKDVLTDEEENRLEELESLVDEDLAAGGWEKAQDDRFDEILRRVLSSRLSDADAQEG